ncbi:MAG: peptide deformylase [Candidatus Paceibacterota bacterium]|jgi:peptide deformylase
MKKILQKESLVLREISKNIPLDSIKSPKIQKIIKEMQVALASQDDGVAIAASQIGYPLRIFVVSKRVEDIMKKEKKQVETSEKPKDLIFINPILKKVSKEKKVVEEGCLSVRYLYGRVSRGNKATVSAWDENGKKFERGGTGLLAQIFQHEMDHLDGILFIDKAKYVEEILPEKINAKK